MSARQIRAGGAYVELVLRDKLAAGLDSAGQTLRRWGTGVAAIGTAVTAAGAAILTPLAAAANEFANFGSAIDDTAQRTGLAAGFISELGYAAEMSGQSSAVLERAFIGMTKTVGSLAAGSKTTAALFRDLGVSADAVLQADPGERFYILADAISRIPDPTLKSAYAMKVFGKAGAGLVPMFADGAAGLEAMREEARRLGLTLDGPDAKAAAALGDAMDTLKRQFQAVKVQIGAALAPVLLELSARFSDALASVIAFVRENRGTIVAVAQIGAALLAAGTAITALGGGIVAVGAVLSGLAAIIGPIITTVTTLGAILTTWPAILAGIAVAAAYSGGFFDDWIDQLSEGLTYLAGRFKDFWDYTTKVFEGIFNALKTGDWGLAAGIAGDAIALAWQTALGKVKEIFWGWADEITKFWRETWAGLRAMFNETMAFLGLKTQEEADAANAAIGDSLAASRNSEIAEADARAKAAQDDLEKRRAALDAKLGQAEEAAAAAKLPDRKRDLPDLGGLPLPEAEKAAGTIVGTFSGSAAGLLGQAAAGNWTERAAKAAEKTNSLLADLLSEVEDSDGLSFT